MEQKKLTRLHQIELQVLAEGQEFMQKRLQEELEKLAAAEGEVSPPQRPAVGPPAPKPHHRARRGGPR